MISTRIWAVVADARRAARARRVPHFRLRAALNVVLQPHAGRLEQWTTFANRVLCCARAGFHTFDYARHFMSPAACWPC